MAYPHHIIEPKWQAFWEENGTFHAKRRPGHKKTYILDMFPYPSGAGLHVGHPLGYTATDILARKRRHEGYDVLHPMGWDAFGLPAENFALKTGTHPEVSTKENIKNFRRQVRSLGFSYDWSREISTTHPNYIRWTQWLFLQMFHKGLLYEQEKNMPFCPSCRAVCANEEVENGAHERCGTAVQQRPFRQWFFRITQYAERLLQDIDLLEGWPKGIREMQKNWIGKNTGVQIMFSVDPLKVAEKKEKTQKVFKKKEEAITVFSTRCDTLHTGFAVIVAPEHPIVSSLPTPKYAQKVADYCAAASQKTTIARTSTEREKTGVFTGRFARNPITNCLVPIFVSDFVLAEYGTGAVFASIHDERDLQFYKIYSKAAPEAFVQQSSDLVAIVPPASTGGEQAKIAALDTFFGGDGVLVNAGEYTGMSSAQAREAIADTLEKNGKGKRVTTYRLRDWVFTRQRFWGEPIPLVRDEHGEVLPLHPDELPLELPELPDFSPDAEGRPPLSRVQKWCNVRGLRTTDGVRIKTAPATEPLENFVRETSTMPNWAGSCWYYLRFMDPRNDQEFCSNQAQNDWGPVDLYVGGAEHAVLHLLYSRFWHKVLQDLGLVNTPEPFLQLKNQGLILGEDGQKMSKSRGNVVNPDTVVSEYGADTLRCFEMFLGPFEAVKTWDAKAIAGIQRFLEKTWRLFQKNANPNDIAMDPNAEQALHQAIQTVSSHIEDFRFNTAISALMVLVNTLSALPCVPRQALETLAILLSPFAPHLAEEVWKQQLGHSGGIAYAPWPQANAQHIRQAQVEIAVQVNGKLRGSFSAPADASKQDLLAAAWEVPNVAKYLENATVKKEIVVPKKLVGFVV